MKNRFEADFLYSLNEQVRYVAMDKSSLAKKFKKDLLKTLKKIWHIIFISKNLFILKMKIEEMMFFSVTVLFTLLMYNRKMSPILDS